MNSKESIIEQKAFKFAIRIINLYKFLQENKKEFRNVKAKITKWNSNRSKCE